MTETQSLDSQRSGLAQLRSLCIQIVQTESELMNKDMIRGFLKPLSKILIDLGLSEWFYKTLASYRQPRTPKRLDGGKASTRKSSATEVGSTISSEEANLRKDRHLLHRTSGETRSLNVHPGPHDRTTGSETEQVSSRETADRYDHLVFLARLDKISHMKKDPRTLLEKLCPKDIDRLEGCDLRRLLDYRWRHRLSDEVLFRYYEGARSLSDPDFKLRILTPRISMTQSTDLDAHKTPQQRVLETLQRTSEQAKKTVIESRYYKLALYCQIENIKKGLEVCGKSTPGVSFSTMALREWIKRAGDSELKEHSVKTWRKQGEKWKILCYRFTPGILEASHEALDDW